MLSGPSANMEDMVPRSCSGEGDTRATGDINSPPPPDPDLEKDRDRHRRWSMAATTIQRGYLRHVFLRKIDATIHSCIQQHCLAHTSAHVHLTALGNANGASPLFGIANDNGTYPIFGIANANRVLWGEYMASPLFGIGNGIASANSSCICTYDSFWK